MTLSKMCQTASLALMLTIISNTSFAHNTFKQTIVTDSIGQLKDSFKPLYMHLAKSIRYPQAAREHSVTGTIVISFDLTIEGTIKNAVILNAKEVKENGYGIDREVIWRLTDFKDKNKELKPGSYLIPITFKIQGLDDPQPLNPEIKNRPNCLHELVIMAGSRLSINY